MVRFLLFSSLISFMTLIPGVESHGGLVSPRSRSEVARDEGIEGAKQGVPPKEYCWHCLNRNNGICGKVDGHDYDKWLDSTGQPMPWKPQAKYQRGQVITVETAITAHHWGHIELHACPKGRQSTQGCLDSYPLEFVEDVDYGMPQDPSYPERGYLAGRNLAYTMKFRLPSNLVGDQVILQWRYITSNSCLPPGYVDYFAGLPTTVSRGNLSLGQCKLPYSTDGSGSPEQFWNCAEISVVDGSSPPPPVAAPVKAPVAAPIKPPVAAPVKPPVTAPVKAPVCVARFRNCKKQACCSGLTCVKKTTYFSQCV